MYITVLVTAAARHHSFLKPAKIGDNINLTRENQVKNKLRKYKLIE